MQEDISSLSIQVNTKNINDATKTLDNYRKKAIDTTKANNSVTNSLAQVTNKFTKMATKVNGTHQIVNKYNTSMKQNQQVQSDINDPKTTVEKFLENLQVYIDRFKTDNSVNGASLQNDKRKAQLLKLEQDEENEKKGVHDPSAIADIIKKYTAIKQQLQQSWEEEEKKQGSWFGWLTASIEDYLNKAQDFSSMTKDLAKNTMGQLTSMVLTFVNTGKLNFKDFAKSIIANIIEISQKLLIFQAFRSIFKWMTGGGAGASTGGLQTVYTGGYVRGFALGGIVGYNDKPGGFTGPGNKYQPAGIVHKGEFVFTKEATKRIGVNNLYALMREANKEYASGGYVDLGQPSTIGLTRQHNNSSSGLNITANVTVNMPLENDSSVSTGNSIDPQAATSQIKAIIQEEISETFRKSVSPGGNLYNVIHAR